MARVPSAATPAGYGLGLRHQHYQWILEHAPAVDWFEIVSENYLGVGGKPRHYLERIRERYPVVLHGVGLGIGGSGPLNQRYLKKLAELAAWTEPLMVSDHLCWTGHRGSNSHDLLPLAYTRETLEHLAERVDAVQAALGRRLFLENPSAYVAFAVSDLDEATFLAELCRRTGCGLLLDVNNLYVNSMNLGVDPAAYLATLHPDWIGYFHLAGHSVCPGIRIDTHDAPVAAAVWPLYRQAARLFPGAGTMVEWDGDVPEFPTVYAELEKARDHRAAALSDQSAALTPGDAGRRAAAAELPLSGTFAAAPAAASWSAVQEVFWRLTTGQRRVDAGDPSLGMLVAGLPAAAAVGMNAYVEAYHARLCDVVRGQYPTLENVLGKADFSGLLRTYLGDHPPTEANIKYAGAHLPAFLEACALPAGFLVPNRTLADVARLEWALEDLFDAPDGPAALPVAVLHEISTDDWSRVLLDVAPAVRVVTCEYDVAPVLAAVRAGMAPEPPVARKVCYLVHRATLDVEYGEIAVAEAAALVALQGGATFEEACAAAQRATEEDEDAVVQTVVEGLGRWFSAGLIHGVSLSPAGRRD